MSFSSTPSFTLSFTIPTTGTQLNLELKSTNVCNLVQCKQFQVDTVVMGVEGMGYDSIKWDENSLVKRMTKQR